jgi:hypothetical protein
MIQQHVVFMSFVLMNLQFLRLGCQSRFVLECPIRRPEGPEVNRPGREAGNKVACEMSAEGAAHNEILECRAFSAHSFVCLFPALRPGLLTSGPSGLKSKKLIWTSLRCNVPVLLRVGEKRGGLSHQSQKNGFLSVEAVLRLLEN